MVFRKVELYTHSNNVYKQKTTLLKALSAGTTTLLS